MPECSIIIPVFNRASLTRACVNHLLAQPPETTDAEIIVVDDGSRDLTARMLAGYGDRIHVVTHQVNSGFATSCNDGALIARGEFLVLLNNDTIPQRRWLDALVEYARRHPKAGIIGSKLLFPNETIQHAGVAFTSTGNPLHLYYGFPGDHPAVNKARQFQAVTGACLLIRRALFEQLGGLDRAYHNVYEDVDLCLRARGLGAEVHYCPESVLYHLQSLTRSPERAHVVPDPFRDDQKSTEYFLLQWSERVERDEYSYYVEDGLLGLNASSYYPRDLFVSPMLAQIAQQDVRGAEADRLLALRAAQVEALLSETIRQRAQLEANELETMWAAPSPTAPLPLTWAKRREATGFFELRAWAAALYLEGRGIEIGALHSPMPLPSGAHARYVDRMSVADLRLQYPELESHSLVEPDIIADGERLEPIPDESQDFVIASHFLEHCQDPIGAIQQMLRVVRPGGIVFLGIPDKRHTFDRRRPVTTFEHLLRDHTEGPHVSKRAHFEEWATLAEDENIGGRSADELMAIDYSIHFHVWTQAEMLELFARLVTELHFDFDVESVIKNGMELIVILRKGAAPQTS